MLWTLQRRILFPRAHIPTPSESMVPPDRIQLDVSHADGRSEGWLLLGQGISVTQPGPVVIYFHGNGELIHYAWPRLRPYLQWGVSVALLEYRGYHQSDGVPSEVGITKDAVQFFDLIAARPEVDAERIMIHGQSLGGGVACATAEQRTPRALILESTFLSVTALARRMGAPGILVRDRFDNERRLPQLAIPTLVLHGKSDQLIPFKHGETLAAIGQQTRFVPLDCGHNDCGGPSVWDPIHVHVNAYLNPPE